jgi:hypothetical protein
MRRGSDQQTALITGSIRGIDVAIAKALAREGARCILTARNAASMDRIVADIQTAGGLNVARPQEQIPDHPSRAPREAPGQIRSESRELRENDPRVGAVAAGPARRIRAGDRGLRRETGGGARPEEPQRLVRHRHDTTNEEPLQPHPISLQRLAENPQKGWIAHRRAGTQSGFCESGNK